MQIAEELERTDGDAQISVFATDIDEDALRIARRGSFPNSIRNGVPETLLSRYFTTTPDGYDASPHRREIVPFSNLSIVKDPPSSRIDLVSSCNVTICFDQELQDFAATVFHYALKEGGCLFLGASAPQAIDELFASVDGRNRIFQREAGQSRRLNLPVQTSGAMQKLDFVAQVEADEPLHDPLANPLISRFTRPLVKADTSGHLTYTSDRAPNIFGSKPVRRRWRGPSSSIPN